jgi:DNA-binding protein HU-beta
VNKSELVTAIANESKLSKAQATRALESFMHTIMKSLKKGDAISLVGFGTFSVKKRAARTGRNPQNGQTIKIPAAKVPSFKAGKKLKETVN